MATARGQLSRYFSSVRRVEPYETSAKRLWMCYQQAFCSDEALHALVCGSKSSEIDRLTEEQTPDDILALISMPDSITIEVPSESIPAGPPLAFVTIRFADRDQAAIDRFREYFLHEVFDHRTLRFASEEEHARLVEVMSQGNVAYLAELVSIDNRAATMALLVTAQRLVVTDRMKVPFCNLLGKCLVSAAIGNNVNTLGNRPVLRLAHSLGLTEIARGVQTRSIQIGTAPEQADLDFGLLLGTTEKVRILELRWASMLDQYTADLDQ